MVLKCEYIARDFDQVTVELSLIPIPEYAVHFIMAQSDQVTHEVICFTYDLHIAVLDSVVHHFYEMSGPVFSHPVAAGHIAIDLCGDGLKNGFNVRPGVR